MTGVIAGAFGAHGLREHVTAERLAVWHTGVEYQMYHALALLVLAKLNVHRAATWLFAAGIVIFSGSLYVLVLSDTNWLGAITPIGGVCFIAGWLWLLVTALRKPQTATR